LLRLSW